MHLVAITTIAICTAIPIIIIACAIYHLAAVANKATRSLEIQTQLDMDLKVFTVAALCYLKTQYDKEHENQLDSPADTLILTAEQMSSAVLVEAGLNARAYNLRHILQAIHHGYTRNLVKPQL